VGSARRRPGAATSVVAEDHLGEPLEHEIWQLTQLVDRQARRREGVHDVGNGVLPQTARLVLEYRFGLGIASVVDDHVRFVGVKTGRLQRPKVRHGMHAPWLDRDRLRRQDRQEELLARIG
jgi:hypothetical protein